MAKEFKLEDKVVRDLHCSNPISNYYWEKDVKEFIRLIIKKFERMEIVSGEVIKWEIKNLSGGL